jgi:hypothetical protein
VVCFNPEAAERDKAVCKRLVASLEEAIAGTDRLSATKRAELRGQLSTKPGLHRFLKVTAGGLLRSTAPRSPPRPAWTANSCCAAPTRSSAPKTSRWVISSCFRLGAAGGT